MKLFALVALVLFSLQLRADEQIPKSMTAEQMAGYDILDLEKLYLEELCADKCEDELGYVYNPVDPLTLAEQIVVYRYTINNSIDNARIIVEAANKLPKTKAVVYHGGHSSWLGIKSPGQVVTVDDLKSTSLKRETSEGFVKDQLMKIKATSVRNISRYSGVYEQEHFMLKGTKLRIDKISYIKIKYTNFEDDKETTEIRKVRFVDATEIP